MLGLTRRSSSRVRLDDDRFGVGAAFDHAGRLASLQIEADRAADLVVLELVGEPPRAEQVRLWPPVR